MPGLRLHLLGIATSYRLMSVPLYKCQFPSAEGILKANLTHVRMIWLESSADGRLWLAKTFNIRYAFVSMSTGLLVFGGRGTHALTRSPDSLSAIPLTTDPEP